MTALEWVVASDRKTVDALISAIFSSAVTMMNDGGCDFPRLDCPPIPCPPNEGVECLLLTPSVCRISSTIFFLAHLHLRTSVMKWETLLKLLGNKESLKSVI